MTDKPHSESRRVGGLFMVEVVLGFKLLGFTNSQTAEELGVSEDAVRRVHNRAKDQARRWRAGLAR